MKMNSIPEDYELLGFFETEPKLSTKGTDLLYNKAVYKNEFNDEGITFSIEPMYGEIKIEITRNNLVTGKYILNEINDVSIQKGWKSETLIVNFKGESNLKIFKLRLKPLIQVEWGNDKGY